MSDQWHRRSISQHDVIVLTGVDPSRTTHYESEGRDAIVACGHQCSNIEIDEKVLFSLSVIIITIFPPCHVFVYWYIHHIYAKPRSRLLLIEAQTPFFSS